MSDIIALLPDHIANQIAAGEVVQRPASVVKELLENSVDAGATEIRLIVKEAGKQHIQVIDNGKGMSESDARRSIERHATSKIRKAEDLFNIYTMGFRGEALASIAAVAQVEIKTRRAEDELGTQLQVEDSVVKRQEPCQAAVGTQFSVRNLFYNTPARRQFLKSDQVELRHVIDEFQRVALAHPEIEFYFKHNDTELFKLPISNIRKRIIGILGPNTNDKIVPVDEETDAIKVSGFIGKPELSKKSRGDQFFFVNSRYIKNSYLHHAVSSVYQDLIPKENVPFYVIFIEIDPNKIDVNVHPTKTEIKFTDDRQVYDIIKVATRHALSVNNILPSIDFETPTSITQIDPSAHIRPRNTDKGDYKIPSNLRGGADTEWPTQYNPDAALQQVNLENWQQLFGTTFEQNSPSDSSWDARTDETEEADSIVLPSNAYDKQENKLFAEKQDPDPYQLHGMYIITPIRDGFMLIDQHAAHQRILYERYIMRLAQQQALVQKIMFPRTIELSVSDSALLLSLLPDLNVLGFEVVHFGGNTFVVHGIPAELPAQDEVHLIEELITQIKDNTDLHLTGHRKLALSMAKNTAMKRGTQLKVSEMRELIDQLFACEISEYSPTGQRCFMQFELSDIRRSLGAI